MKKRTAKCFAVILAISYLALIAGCAAIWMFKRSEGSTQETLSEASASDNVNYGDEKQELENVIGEDTKTEDEPTNEVVPEEIVTKEPEVTVEPEEHGHAKMVFTGDVYIGNYVRSIYDVKGIHGVLSEHLLEQFHEADFALVNQEFPFSTRGKPMENKQYTFRVDPAKVKLLTEMGVDMVSLANNHALDYGVDALLDTYATLQDAGITYVGAGKDLGEAATTRYVDLNGKKAAILSASRVIPDGGWAATDTRPGMFTTYDPTALLAKIKEARQEADLVIVYLHWGLERKEYPEKYQKNMGHQFIDAGADVVIGSHPHVLQGFEYYKDRLIVYSLGNFIFSQNIASTALLTIDMDDENQLEYHVTPCKTVEGKTQELVDEHQIQSVYQYLEKISEHTVIDRNGYIREK